MHCKGNKSLPEPSPLSEHVESKHANEQRKHNAQCSRSPVEQLVCGLAITRFAEEVNNPERQRKGSQEHRRYARRVVGNPDDGCDHKQDAACEKEKVRRSSLAMCL